MNFGFLGKLFDSNEKEIQKLTPIISEINSFQPQVAKVKDTAFARKTEEFRKRVAEGESLDLLLPEAFAHVREAAKRSIGQRHFDVQLMAAVTLSSGKIAEQKTGEGKTLSAIPALYLHALTGKSVHLVTVNDYLARRDAGWMGPVFNLLGMSVSAIISEQSFIFDPTYTDKNVHDVRLAHLRPVSRGEAYKADVVYGINSEFGFDYLRDNMASDIANVVQRGYYFAVVDEVDSVLIDEARTPHIISAPDEVPTQKYYQYAQLVDKLNSEVDYKIDEKLRTAHLTDHGISKIEKLFGIANIYEKDFDTVYHLEAALKARTLFHKEKDYIVKDNEVILVDEFTGRLMQGRRLSEGLHQALEAKEGVPIQRESKTLATVSLQNYFRQYQRLSGMTGTAVTEAEEFNKIYKLDVVVIPTNNSVARKDHADAIYKTGRAKLSAVADSIAEAHKKGQPVLVGTTSIEKNEIVSELLRRRGIKHELLNAKNHEREAEIIAQAGAKGAVTVATNMAGRGVDIVLGGESPSSSDKESKEWKAWEKKHQEVLDAGGLLVVGTERHESRRIDNQLRGRSGRQGDPGASQFFVALDDEIMRLFGGETIAGLMTRFNMPEDVPLQHALVSRAIEQAQVKVEGFNFDIRKHLVQYDDVLNKQREIIYKMRRRVLEISGSPESSEEAATVKEEIQQKIKNSISMLVNINSMQETVVGQSSSEKIIADFATIIPFDEASQKQLVVQLEQKEAVEDKTEFLSGLAMDIYKQREEQLGVALMPLMERSVVLSVIDAMWMDHLDAIDHLRQGIGLRGYAQKDPLVEYKNEAFRMFEQLMSGIDDDIVHRIYRASIVQQPTDFAQHSMLIEQAAGVKKRSTDHRLQSTAQKKGSAVDSGQSTVDGQTKLGRNDPCYCGSGKKYKKCHLSSDLGR